MFGKPAKNDNQFQNSRETPKNAQKTISQTIPIRAKPGQNSCPLDSLWSGKTFFGFVQSTSGRHPQQDHICLQIEVKTGLHQKGCFETQEGSFKEETQDYFETEVKAGLHQNCEQIP